MKNEISKRKKIINLGKGGRIALSILVGSTFLALSTSSMVSCQKEVILLLNKDSLELQETKEETLIAKVSPDGTKISWASEDDKIAKVDENGKVTGVSAGRTKITASAGNKNAVCEVNIVPSTLKTKFINKMKVFYQAFQTSETKKTTTDITSWKVNDTEVKVAKIEYSNKDNKRICEISNDDGSIKSSIGCFESSEIEEYLKEDLDTGAKYIISDTFDYISYVCTTSSTIKHLKINKNGYITRAEMSGDKLPTLNFSISIQ